MFRHLPAPARLLAAIVIGLFCAVLYIATVWLAARMLNRLPQHPPAITGSGHPPVQSIA